MNNQAAISPVEQVYQSTMDRYEYQRETAVLALEDLIYTATKELERLTVSGAAIPATDFIAGKASNYAEAIVAGKTLNDTLASLNWLRDAAR